MGSAGSSIYSVIPPELKPLEWTASALKDLRGFPEDVKDEIGYALLVAQRGGKADTAKPLSSFGSGVFETVSDYKGDTYRTIYTVRYRDTIYVLHCFKKKSKSGIKTPQSEKEIIRIRMKAIVERRKKEGKPV